MNTIPHQLEVEATNLWIVESALDHTPRSKPKLFRSLDEATQWTHNNIAKGIRLEADLKHTGSDDKESPPGTLTGLTWSCPMRKMTKDECLAPKSRFAQDWIKSGNHPNMSDLEAARRQQIEFVNGDVTHVSIYRVSRYLGYIWRASALNDKSRDVAELIEAWEAIQ